nr:endonuclease-reverse transcriptase [Haemonchus contortus]
MGTPTRPKAEASADVGALVNTHLAVYTYSNQTPTTRIGRLRLRRCGSTPTLAISFAYAPIPTYEERSWKRFIWIWRGSTEEATLSRSVIVGDFNAKEELPIGTHGMEWNERGERLSEFIMSSHTIYDNSQFQKPSHLRWTWESRGGQFHNEIDHIIINRKFRLTDVAVVPKFYTGSDHRPLCARFCLSVRGERARKRSPRPLSTGTTPLPLRVNWKIPLSTTSKKDTTDSSNIFTIAPGKQRVYK